MYNALENSGHTVIYAPSELQCVSKKNGSPKSWSASIDSPAFLLCCSVMHHTSFERSRFKDSNERLFALRGEHYLLLGQRKE